MLALLLSAFLVADDPAADLKLMQGTWTVISMDGVGKHVVFDREHARRMEFQDDAVSLYGGEKRIWISKVTNIDAVADPHVIDLTRESDQQTILGIYKLDGDELTLCTSSNGIRPSAFSTDESFYNIIWKLKRTKPDK